MYKILKFNENVNDRKEDSEIIKYIVSDFTDDYDLTFNGTLDLLGGRSIELQEFREIDKPKFWYIVLLENTVKVIMSFDRAEFNSKFDEVNKSIEHLCQKLEGEGFNTKVIKTRLREDIESKITLMINRII